MYDGDFVNEEAKHFAERIRKEAGPDTREQIERAFLLAFGRRPIASELQDARAFVQTGQSKQNPLIGLCRVLLNANEYVYVD